jgi:hypothetical protein
MVFTILFQFAVQGIQMKIIDYAHSDTSPGGYLLEISTAYDNAT